MIEAIKETRESILDKIFKYCEIINEYLYKGTKLAHIAFHHHTKLDTPVGYSSFLSISVGATGSRTACRWEKTLSLEEIVISKEVEILYLETCYRDIIQFTVFSQSSKVGKGFYITGFKEYLDEGNNKRNS